ncbi:Flp family type IVb pilin [Arthrobacter bambusae]|jgi:pilus assembly protein Flp/PilA|uniref:Flp family type IVb pilin n=1 Tax=Arthrobacter bambusae TaxID=1338426 RepID=UPI0027824A31|nr:Flp family type IVb pilin [Arthrobacter bambusae]MDQ0212096.1 pilus assembly protein Flp/PilA [Arthrobacter bambusae]MDQ0236761.1 pilus assembly protein Flp/PilA [Arthrobacter bambusae]
MLSAFLKSASHVRRDETGATAVEYGIMVALIAVVIIAAVTLLGGSVKDTFTQVQCSMTTGKTYTAGASAGLGACN